MTARHQQSDSDNGQSAQPGDTAGIGALTPIPGLLSGEPISVDIVLPTRENVTMLLREVADGQTGSDQRLLEAVYVQLHTLARQRMSSERSGHTLGATGLVHEVYAKMFAAPSGVPTFADRAHFFRAAAQAMRRVLIDYARARLGSKRGGDGAWRRVSLEGIDLARDEELDGLLSVDEAICRLEKEDERAATVVRLRFYGGLDPQKVADLLGINVRSVGRDWAFARAWLASDLTGRDAGR